MPSKQKLKMRAGDLKRRKKLNRTTRETLSRGELLPIHPSIISSFTKMKPSGKRREPLAAEK